MEHTLGVSESVENSVRVEVLILVLMEHTLGVRIYLQRQGRQSLNPCFNGTYSRSLTYSFD